MTDIVEQVAEEIAKIRNRASDVDIARLAIEVYRRALWPGAFERPNYLYKDVRRVRAQHLTAHIMSMIGDRLCDHGERNSMRDVAGELFEALYESGAEIITDADRATAGLPARDGSGMTVEQLRVLEARRLEVMRRPVMFAIPAELAPPN